jgi:hypothetical protein
MPGIAHEAPLELLRRNPQLADVLLRGLGVAVPAAATAQMASTDLGASVPTELRADAVIVLSGTGGARLTVGLRPTLCSSGVPHPSRPGRRWRP